jgi:hypothetical protein
MLRSRKAAAPILFTLAVVGAFARSAPTHAYPPGVGITGKELTCLGCHVDNGPWKDEAGTIIDILSKETGKSLRQADGRFVIEAQRGRTQTVVTVIGRVKEDERPTPYRNAWLYVDPTQLKTSSLSKFAPGWMVNLPMSCRIVGDKLAGFDGAVITTLPMSVRPLDDARDAELQLQVMLTRGESVKGDAKKGMIGNYFERKVLLKVID